MELIDTHAHLFSEYFEDGEIDAAIDAARRGGLIGLIDVATRLDDAREVVALAEAVPEVWAAVGVHPHEASSLEADPAGALDELRRLAASARVVAIGECGLDYHYDHSPRDVQRAALRRQIHLARELGMPVILHNRESDADLLEVLAEEGAAEVGGVVHAFSTDEEVAGRLLEMGFYLGFGGMITFRNADRVRRALTVTPLERLLLETDTPYLTPEPHRGKRNTPAHVRLVAERAAELLGIELELLAARTTDNARRLFGLA